jgi:trans-2,3-dihydro-3-hydroxyanthranilate isomerase
MSGLKFFIVDIFAVEKYSGNPLAVVMGSAAGSDIQMQRIAKEMNDSETTFVLSEGVREGGYDVRIFTPERELPFAGHPTLGTAYILQKEIIKAPIERVDLNLKVGQIPVTLYYREGEVEMLWMQQQPPKFLSALNRETVAKVQGQGIVGYGFYVSGATGFYWGAFCDGSGAEFGCIKSRKSQPR